MHQKTSKGNGVEAVCLVDAGPDTSFLGSWHANLIHIDRRKCILFVNDKTLFNFIAPDVTRAQIRELDVLFRSYLSCVLSEEGIESSQKTKCIAEAEEVAYLDTNNRSVLGSMNDLAFHYKLHIIATGGVHSSSVPSIISQLNHMPMGAIKYAYPVDELRALCATAT